MSNTIGSIVVEMAADIAGFRGKLNEAVKATNEAVEKIKTGFELIGVGLSVESLIEFTKSTIELGDQLYRASLKAGINAGAFSELAFAAKSSGLGVDELSAALAKMQKAISSEGSGTGSAKAAFEALGVTFDDLKRLTPDQQFTIFAERINELKVPADRTRAAIELFGRSGADLLPLFSQGAEGIAKARMEAGLLGASFSDETVERMHLTQESIDHLTASLKGLGVAIVVDVAPELALLADRLTGFISGDEITKVSAQIALLQIQLEQQHSGYFGPAAGAATDKELLSLEMKLSKLKLIEQLSIDMKNQGINGLLDTLGAPPGYTPPVDLSAITINPNLKIREDSLKKFYEDMDAITQTGGEKLFSDTALLQARLDVLVKDGIISQSDAFNRARGPADAKALSEFFTTNKAIIGESTKAMADDFKESFAEQAAAARAAGEAMRAEYEKTGRLADQFSGTISNTFAQAFENIGKGGLRGLVANFASAFKQIVAQAEAMNLAKSLGLGSSSEGGSSFLSALAGLFTGGWGGSGGGGSGVTNGAGNQDVPRWATGGSFMVGGSGGTDSQLVKFKASPNERVTISTPGQTQGVTVVNHNYIDARTDSTQIAQLIASSTQRAVQQSKAEMTQLIKRGGFA
jgi:hypothetical protein